MCGAAAARLPPLTAPDLFPIDVYKRQAVGKRRAKNEVVYEKFKKDNPDAGSNPFSRWQQKRAIKKEYALSLIHIFERCGLSEGSG